MRRKGSSKGWLGAAGLAVLLCGAPPGLIRAQDGAIIDLTLDGPSGRTDSGEVIDLTLEGPPGRLEAPGVIDLTDASPGEVEADGFFDLTGPDSVSRSGLPAASTSVSSVPASNALPSAPVAQALPAHGKVVRVIDGDTYELEGGYRIRLASVNTPEKKERVGPQVGDAVRKLLLYQEVTLTYGPTPRDHYGRLIAEVRVAGQSVAEILLRQGLAHMFIIPPGRPENYDALVAAQREARAAKRGIWTEARYVGPLHITSFHANAKGDDRQNLAGEYLRIANTSGQDLNLSGFSLTNQRGLKLAMPNLVIPTGYSFQVFSGKGEPQGSLETPYRVFWQSEGPVWDNDDDRATLRDPDGKVIDEVIHAPERAHPRSLSANM